MRTKAWLVYAITVTVLWGVWGALIELPEKAGFPATLGYSVWALTMIPVSLIALKKVNWQLNNDKKSILYGMLAGLLGSGGQLILFQTLRIGPAYIVFPIISLYPVVTIILSIIFLKERASKKAWAGIILALIAILLLSYVPPENSATEGLLWLILAITVFIMWGIQAYIIKLASSDMNSESITFYTMASSIVLTPIAFMMTNFSEYINWGMSGSFAAIIIQSLNAVGFLFFAYALKYGKAIIVVPMMSLAPVITVIISLILYSVMPHAIVTSGMILAFIAIYLMAE